MYRLVIVSGPNRGSSFTLSEGENTIGRQLDNHIVLTSSKVSKRHCSILVGADGVFLRDETSTNGTFVNGSMVRKHTFAPGDKLGVGDFVLELVRVGVEQRSQHPLSVYPGAGPVPQAVHGNLALAMPPPAQPQTVAKGVVVGNDPASRAQFVFEGKVMPFFYGHLMKTEYRVIVSLLIGLLVGVSVVSSVMPTLDLAQKSIQKEAFLRAKILSREVADRYLPAVASHAGSQIDLSLLENEESVKMVAIVNLDLQIIAPQSRLNQILAGGKEAALAMRAAKTYRDGHEGPVSQFLDDHTVAYIEPLKIVDPRQVKSDVAAMAIVSIDFSGNVIETGGMGVAYGIGLLIAGVVAFLIYNIILRMTLKPFEVLNDDLDQVLRGELPKVTHEFKINELNNLWENINSALQRNSKSSGTGTFYNEAIVNWESELAAIRTMADASSFAFIGFDSAMRVVGLNQMLDDVMGIRMDALGQTVQNIANDTAFIALVSDLKERAQHSPSRSAMEPSEFGGIQYDVVGMSYGPADNSGLALVFKKRE